MNPEMIPSIWDPFSGNKCVGLVPWAWVQFESAEHPGPFPFLGGVAPRVVACLHEVYEHLSGAIDIAISDVFAGRAAANDPGVRIRLENAYAEVVHSRPHLSEAIRCGRGPDGTFSWDYPLDPTESAVVQYTGLRLFNALTRETAALELRPHVVQAVGRLLGGLNGTRTVAEVRNELLKQGTTCGPEVKNTMIRLLDELNAHGCLTLGRRSSVHERWLAATQDRDLVHLGHAALLYRHRDRFLLFDPWLVPWFAEAPLPSLWATLLPKPAAIFLTHDHDDHLDPRTLLAFPKETPVIVPSRKNRRALFYDYEALLRALGFTQIIELAHGEIWEFDGGGVEAVPFYGECACELGMPRNCYGIADRGRNVLIHVDSGPTNSGENAVRDGIIEALVRRHGPIEAVYAQPGQLLELRAFSAYACLSPPGRWLEVGENCCVTSEYLTQLIATAKARLLVTYANGGADWLPDHPVFVFSGRNRALRELITAHWWPLEDLQASLAAQGCRVHQSQALDMVRAGSDRAFEVLVSTAPSPEQLYRADHGDLPWLAPRPATAASPAAVIAVKGSPQSPG